MKTFKFYDTSSLLILRDTLFQDEYYSRFGISSITLKELESIKTSTDKDSEIKYGARRLLSTLNENFDKFDLIIFKPEMLKPLKEKDLYTDINDMKILASACYYDKYYHPDETVFVTNDMSLYAIANLFFGDDSIETVGYYKEDHYKGYLDVTASEEEMAYFYQNQQSKWFGEVKPIKNDIYQAFAADSLMNNQLTMLKGPAGSGKTYLALGYLFQKLDKGAISKIIIFCNTVATRNSAKLGYYPGSRDEKLLDSQIGNLLVSKLGSRIEVERLVDEDKLVLLPLSDIRGYEAPEDSGVYISEAQNLDIDLMQLALTRIGDKAICVIDGDDTTQVDLPAYAGEYNGMKRVSQVYRGCDAYGEIELQIVHRGKIADLARKLKTLHY